MCLKGIDKKVITNLMACLNFTDGSYRRTFSCHRKHDIEHVCVFRGWDGGGVVMLHLASVVGVTDVLLYPDEDG